MNKTIPKLSVIIGVTGAFISAFVLGSYTGFSLISTLCDVRYPIIGGLGWVSGLDPYIKAFDYQLFVCVFSVTYLIGKCFRKGWFANMSCLISVVLLAVQIFQLFMIKLPLWNRADAYLRLSHEMFPYELAIVVTTLLLLLCESFIFATFIRMRLAK